MGQFRELKNSGTSSKNELIRKLSLRTYRRIKMNIELELGGTYTD